MNAEVLKPTKAAIEKAAMLIEQGELVAFPTETVYGLGANALDEAAVKKIFAAKNRPCDNPLIVHIADTQEAKKLCHWNENAQKAADAFWPGPLTLLLPKKDIVPKLTTAGLASVALRMPGHETALLLIRASGKPLAAPSANKSGRPSPTQASHVLEDMQKDIPLILDGGACEVGLESTVLDLCGDIPTIFRPGGITQEQIASVLGSCRLADSVMRKLKEGEQAPSPGMKHRHYAPKASMVLVKGVGAQAYIKKAYDAEKNACILCFEEHVPIYENRRVYSLGSGAKEAAQRLFGLLRRCDEEKIEHIFAEVISEKGVGLALMNRMLRASSFTLIDAK